MEVRGLAKRMTEQIAAAEKSVSEQIENARIRAAQIAADAKDKAKKSEEAILKGAEERAAQIVKAAQDDAENEKKSAVQKAQSDETVYQEKYTAKKAAAIQKAEEILCS